MVWRGTGGRVPGSNGAGSVRQAREKRADDGILKGTGAGTNYEKINIAKLHNISQ